jgi:DMSO/TMAO reductase YedYZ molybdopterin-dependent catalytic subunit
VVVSAGGNWRAHIPAAWPRIWSNQDVEISRRAFVRALSLSSIALLTASCSLVEKNVGFHPAPKASTPFVTAKEDFFVVAVDPTYRPAFDVGNVATQWHLDLVGLDGRSTEVGYDELSLWAKRKAFYTLECIGNPVGGQLIGNALWDVIPLRELLRRASGGIRGTRAVRFEGLDGFYSSVSLERAIDDYAFLAIRMNGLPLASAHGFPARVLLPDLYGKKQPRWLKRISLSEDPRTSSYWEQRGWAGEVPVKTTSRFDLRGKLRAGRSIEISGVAYAGRRGIRKVEVSVDNDEWAACTLLGNTSPNVWSPWRYQWESPSAGRHTLFVRATDGTGKLQTGHRQGAFPDGASGYHKIEVEAGV